MSKRLFLSVCALLFSSVAAQAEPHAEFLSSFEWREKVRWFGGFSGIDMSPDGQTFWIVSDQGYASGIDVERNGLDGPIVGVSGYTSQWLRQPDGDVVLGDENDAEGIAVAENGDVYVSYEAEHRIHFYSDIERNPAPWPTSTAIPAHPDFIGLQRNSSLEALAIDPDGAVIAIPERSGVLTRPYPIYRFRNGQWDTDLSIPRRPPFLVVGADFGPDGKLYILERNLNGFFGFQSRVRRFDYGPDGLSNEVQILQSRSGRHDNLEGISVWRDAQGNIRLTLISDNNLMSFQRTEIVEYVVKE